MTESQTKTDASLNRVWRNEDEGRPILLHVTGAGLAAIGLDADEAPRHAERPEPAEPVNEAPNKETSSTACTLRLDPKQAQLIELLP